MSVNVEIYLKSGQTIRATFDAFEASWSPGERSFHLSYSPGSLKVDPSQIVAVREFADDGEWDEYVKSLREP